MLFCLFALLTFFSRWTAGYSPPRFDPAVHESALKRWEAKAPPDYDLEVTVTGSQPALYRVEVRGGEPRQAWRNNQPLGQKRSFFTWTVDGMFGTLAEDRARWQSAEKMGGQLPFSLRVAYDPNWGYPVRYQRREYSSAVEVDWQVTRFEILRP